MMAESDKSKIEADSLRDEVIRRMANTKPKPKGESSPKQKEPSNPPKDGKEGG